MIILHPLEKITSWLRCAAPAARVEMAAIVGTLLQYTTHSARYTVFATRKERVGPLEVAAATTLFDAAPKQPVLGWTLLAGAQQLGRNTALAQLL